jgi:hypothetical protein
MNSPASYHTFQLFIGVWVVLGLGSAAFFYFNKNTALKRRVMPPFVIFTSILFLAFVWVTGAPIQVFYVFVPAVAVIAFINIRKYEVLRFLWQTKLWNYGPNLFSPAKFCSKCGAPLK